MAGAGPSDRQPRSVLDRLWESRFALVVILILGVLSVTYVIPLAMSNTGQGTGIVRKSSKLTDLARRLSSGAVHEIPPSKGGGSEGYRFASDGKIKFYLPPPGEMSRPKPNGVILMKIGPKKRHPTDALRALCLLDGFMNDKYQYPVILWHNSVSEEMQNKIYSAVRSDVTFVKLVEDETTIPSYVDKSKVPEKVAGAGLGYRHMNQFRVVDMWNHPALKGYDYYMSIDADTYISEPVPYDPFRRMVDQDLVYGYVDYHRPDPHETVVGMWDAVKQYVHENHIKPDHLHDFVNSKGHYTRKVYYGCFQMGKLSFFRSKEYTDFAMYLARLGGIYYHRWADQGIYPIALSLFVPRAQVVEFEDFPFFHVAFAWPNERRDKRVDAVPPHASGNNVCVNEPNVDAIGTAAR